MKGKEGTGDGPRPDAMSGSYSSGSGLCPSREKGFFADPPYLITANILGKSFLSSFTPRIRLLDQISGTIEYYQSSERGMLFHRG